MTDSPAELRARAQEAFRKIAELVRQDAIAEYHAKHQAEVNKAARLKAMRLAKKRSLMPLAVRLSAVPQHS